MKKFFSVLAISTILMTSTPLAAEAGTNLEQGETLIEFGSSLNSKVKGSGALPLEVGGKSGFKSAITYALDDNINLQYRKNMFKSKEKTVTMGPYSMTTHANADLSDYNVLYRLNDYNSLILGYENNKITYDKYVNKATRSSYHIGLNTVYPLNEKTAVFANLIYGKKVSSKEIGMNFNLTDKSLLAVSYIDRRVNDMDVKIPLVGFSNKVDYKMTGIAIMYGYKF